MPCGGMRDAVWCEGKPVQAPRDGALQVMVLLPVDVREEDEGRSGSRGDVHAAWFVEEARGKSQLG